MLKNVRQRAGILIISTLLCACVLPPAAEKNASVEKDSGPVHPLSVDHIPEPVPREEPRTSAGNYSPYTVLGAKYTVVQNPEGFRQKGVASWYGRKFHGKKTANGELYDMYGMTAAHKTLPIPCYVRVTNVHNRHSVIVRVNDRGPFHGDRIIDLTYTAAKKLGYAKGGTAEVTVEYIDPKTYVAPAAKNVSVAAVTGVAAAPTPKDSAGYAIPNNTYLQVGAFSQKSAAQGMKVKLTKLTEYPVLVVKPNGGGDTLFRVRIGPLKNNLDLMNLRQTLINNAFSEPHVVYP